MLPPIFYSYQLNRSVDFEVHLQVDGWIRELYVIQVRDGGLESGISLGLGLSSPCLSLEVSGLRHVPETS